MTLEVIGAGFGRTGTASLKAALEILGYEKTHHMFEVMGNKEQMRKWHAIAAASADQVDWDSVYEGYRAAVDFPTASYWRELSFHYPQAKLILTTRSTQSWWQSASETIIAIGKAPPAWARSLVPPIRRNVEMTDGTVWNRMFDGRQQDEAHAKHVFETHNAKVMATIPPERLLVYEVKEGWGPLCAFLGKPVPDEPFPHVNDTAAFKAEIGTIRAVFAALHALVAMGAIAAIWALARRGIRPRPRN